MGFFSDDIVSDLLRRVVEAAGHGGGFDDSMAMRIEEQVRADWGGSRPYIQHDRVSARIARDDKIMAAFDAGQHDTRALATRFGLSERQIRNILNK